MLNTDISAILDVRITSFQEIKEVHVCAHIYSYLITTQ